MHFNLAKRASEHPFRFVSKVASLAKMMAKIGPEYPALLILDTTLIYAHVEKMIEAASKVCSSSSKALKAYPKEMRRTCSV